MKKTLTIILIIALLLPIFSISAYAADDLTNSEMVDAQGGFFREIFTAIADGFNKSIDNAKNGINSILSGLKNVVNAIGGFFADIARVITNAFDALCEFIVDLILPSKDYFPRIQLKLQTELNKKLGGITSFTGYLQGRFSALKSNPNSDKMMVLEFPQNHMFGGGKIDFIRFIRPAIPDFRDLISALMVLATAIFCYHSVKGMINT